MTNFCKLILLAICVLWANNTAYSQSCPVCTIDLMCDSTPPAPIMCPDTLPSDTAQKYYEEQVTFYLPQQFDVTQPISTTVTLNQIDVVGVSNLPPGMDWTSYDYTGNATTSFFPTSNPPASERACATICGTPLMPGDYNIQITVIAYVTASGQSVTQTQTFPLPLTIYPSPSGNSVFTMTNSIGCDSVITSFAPILQSNGDPLYSYNWDFGDGNTSTSEFPTHTYSTPGDYAVTGTTAIYNYVITDVSVSTTNDDWCGDIEEASLFGACQGNPDVFFRVNDNSSLQTSTTVSNNTNASWSNLGMAIDGNQFTIQFWDEDGGPPFGSPNDDLGSTIINVTGSGTYNVMTISPNAGTQAINGTLTIGTQLDTSYTDSDSVHVFAPTPVDSMVVSPTDSVCKGDSITVTAYSGNVNYAWHEDTTELVGVNDSFYVAYTSGNYWVEVTNQLGCKAKSDTAFVTVVDVPPSPSIVNFGTYLQTYTTGFDLQWYLEGNPIPGATADTLVFNESGNYQLAISNEFGCTTFSQQVFIIYSPQGVDEFGDYVAQFLVFPNPTTGKFTIQNLNHETKNVELTVYNVLGEQVQQLIIKSANQQIDLSALPQGIYFLEINIGGKPVNKKIVKY